MILISQGFAQLARRSQQVTKLMRRWHIPCVFLDEITDDRLVKIIAAELGVAPGGNHFEHAT